MQTSSTSRSSTQSKETSVDDCLKSVSTEQQAISLTKDHRALGAMGGFKITKWISNSRLVLASIPDEEKAKEVKELSLDRTTTC